MRKTNSSTSSSLVRKYGAKNLHCFEKRASDKFDSYAYAETRAGARSRSGLLASARIAPGDKVAITGRRQHAWIISELGCSTPGRSACPVGETRRVERPLIVMRHAECSRFGVSLLPLPIRRIRAGLAAAGAGDRPRSLSAGSGVPPTGRSSVWAAFSSPQEQWSEFMEIGQRSGMTITPRSPTTRARRRTPKA